MDLGKVAIALADKALKQGGLASLAYNVRNNISLVTNGNWTQAIQAALDNNKTIYIPYDAQDYIIDDRLLIDSGKHLIADLNARIYLKSGSNTCMIRNKNMLSQTPDNTIVIEGGIWDGNAAGNSTPRYSPSDKINPLRGVSGLISMIGANNVTLRNITVKDCKGFAVQVANCDRLLIDSIYFDDIKRDGIHLCGSVSNFSITNIYGKTKDDVIALNSWDWLDSTPAYGNIHHGVIDNVNAEATLGALVKIHPATENAVKYNVYNITVRKLTGIGYYSGVTFGYTPDAENPSHVASEAEAWNIRFEDLDIKTSNNLYAPFNIAAITLHNLDIVGVNYDNTNQRSYLNVYAGNSLVKQLNFSNFTCKDPAAQSIIDIAGNVEELNISNVHWKATTGGFSQSFIRTRDNATSPKHINISNFTGNGGTAIFHQGKASGNTVLNITNFYLQGSLYGVYAFSNLTVNWSNGLAESIVTAVNTAAGNAASVRVVANDSAKMSSAPITAETGSTISLHGPKIATNVGLLTPQANDMAINNNAALGCGVGLVLRDNANTQWKNVFSGATA